MKYIILFLSFNLLGAFYIDQENLIKCHNGESYRSTKASPTSYLLPPGMGCDVAVIQGNQLVEDAGLKAVKKVINDRDKKITLIMEKQKELKAWITVRDEETLTTAERNDVIQKITDLENKVISVSTR